MINHNEAVNNERTSVTKRYKFWLTLALGLTMMVPHSQAQQQPLFTQYMFNGLVINPAYTGSHESVTATVSYRTQWTGLKGSPQTQVASLHSPLKFSRSAAGVMLVHDEVGVTNQYGVTGTYAYRIPVSRNAKLAIGAQAGMTFYRANLSDLNVITQNGTPDPTLSQNVGRALPNLGIGAYYYSKTSYIGLSLPTIINNKWNKDDNSAQARQQRHYFLSAGHVFTLNHVLKLKPNVLLKWEEGGPFQYDINANMLIQEVVWVGVSYRMNDSVDGLLEMNINKQLSVGYSYGYPISSVSMIQSGTHEVVLNYRIRKNKNIFFSPRYF